MIVGIAALPGRGSLRGGFTLLEALLALFIFSTAVISLVEAINDTGRMVLLCRKEKEVQSRLESMLLEATRSPDLLSRMNASHSQPHESTIQQDGVSYTTRTASLELKNRDGVNLSGTFVVTVRATWKEGLLEEEASGATWVYLPLFLPQPTKSDK